MVEYDPGEGTQGWRPAGPEGRNCWGGTVAAGWLVVAIETVNAESEVWAFDGRGWWRIDESATLRIWPAATGGAGNFDLIGWRNNSTTYSLYRLVTRSATNHTYPTAGEWVSSLLHAGHPDKPKAWRKVGAIFSMPEGRGNQASGDAVTVALEYSTDAGASWTQAATSSPSSPVTRTLTLEGSLGSNAASSRFLQLRVSWSSVLDWAPVLTQVWADYQVLRNEPKRRRWELELVCRDGQVKRDDWPQSRTGRQLASDLWAAWEEGTTIAYRDVDYDAMLRTHQVRIVRIEETVPKPADAGRWGESVVSVTLVEV